MKCEKVLTRCEGEMVYTKKVTCSECGEDFKYFACDSCTDVHIEKKCAHEIPPEE